MTDRDLDRIRLVLREEIGRALGRDRGEACDDAASESSDPTRYVYFMKSSTTGLIKIGIAFEPEDRRIALCRQLHQEIEIISVLVGGAAEERALHRRFTKQRVRGEWFRESPELLAAVASGMAWDQARGRIR